MPRDGGGVGGGGGGLRMYFCENSPGGFYFFTLPLEIPDKTKFNPWINIPQNCVRSLENFKAKNKDPWKFHITFSWSPLEITLRF